MSEVHHGRAKCLTTVHVCTQNSTFFTGCQWPARIYGVVFLDILFLLCPQVKPKVKFQKQQEPKLWKRKNKEKKRTYKTADELLQEKEDKPNVEMQPILDMRGPQTRVITNLEHLHVAHADEAGDPAALPELQHNLKLLVDMAEAEICRVDSRLKQKEDTAVSELIEVAEGWSQRGLFLQTGISHCHCLICSVLSCCSEGLGCTPKKGNEQFSC